MTVLEGKKGSGVRGQGSGKPAPSSSSPNPEPRTLNPPSRFAKYFTRSGWAHALLLLAAWMFLFPFVWMLATSVKTDEELMEPGVLPPAAHFHPDSPYVRGEIQPIKPSDVEIARWNQMLPSLTELANRVIEQYQHSHPAEPSIAPFDADKHRQSASAALVNSVVSKLDRRLWSGDDKTLTTEFKNLLDETAIAAALSDALARIELISFQIRTLDLHIFNLTKGNEFPAKWTIESGDAKLFGTGDTTRLSYHFDSSSSAPVVLRYDFHLPPGVKPSDLHKLSLTVLADNSWHRADCTFDCDGRRWQSDECIYLAQYRTTSLLFQPPTFDDELMRAKVWTTIKEVGPFPENKGDVALYSTQGIPAVLRVTLSPSSTLRANWGKVFRNYDRAFKSVPFWRYITNSLLLVALVTVGSLFSASFVAYAFARLNWPGRSIAFLLLLATMMLPSQVTMIPGFIIWKSLHWYNTLNPLWVPAFFGSAFFIFLMTQHMRTIPKELEEAARLDGLNAVQSWYYIILPNVTPTLAAIAILSFIGAWNEFMAPLIYLRDQTRFPLSLGLYGLGLLNKTQTADYSWSVIMAGNMLMTFPVILVFFLFQRYFVQGMTLTGMKG
jgi:ABC-type glycerol-3-phosphate transport system permease component